MATGKLVFSITVDTSAMERGLRRCAKLLKRHGTDLYRSAWWKRGEGEPEYLADLQEPEWWRDGDEPPDWSCAA